MDVENYDYNRSRLEVLPLTFITVQADMFLSSEVQSFLRSFVLVVSLLMHKYSITLILYLFTMHNM